MKIKKAILFIIGIIGLVNIVFQARAGELGNSRGSSSNTPKASKSFHYYQGVGSPDSKIGSHEWIKNSCYKIGFPKSEIIQTYEAAVAACPKLRDYSAVEVEYKQWLKEAAAAKTPVPAHTPGSICKTKHSWFWAHKIGTPGAKCKAYLPANTFLEGTLI